MNVSAESIVETLLSAGYQIEQWSLRGAGQNRLAILANDEWVFRYPLHRDAANSMELEVAVLQAIHGRLPVFTPDPEIFVDVAGLEWRVMAYPFIVGQILGVDQINELGGSALSRLGKDLGRFLTTLHSTPTSLFSGSELRDEDGHQRWVRFTEDVRNILKPRVTSSIWNRLNRKLSKSVEKITRFQYEPVLRHGDFGFRNFIFDDRSRLTGVIDFGSAGLGDPAVDVASLIATNGPGDSMIDHVSPAYPLTDDLLLRARIYRDTFPLQHALLGAKSDDELAIKEGIDSYLNE
jgi:aminoglycoside 2''-phosphotransferase